MPEIFDYNHLKSNAFNFAIKRLPQTMFRIVNGELPSIGVPPAPAGDIGATQYFAGSAIEFDPVVLEFIVDDNLFNYEEIYHWITDQQFDTRGEKFTAEKNADLYSDGFLVTMDRSSNPNRVFQFRGMFPVTLGSMRFDTAVSSPEPVVCQVTFRYAYFTLEPKGAQP